MTGLPGIQVLLDNGAGAFPYDITANTRIAYTVSRGRQDEQSSVTPGQLALILDNNDGRFTLGSTTIASPSPIRVDQRIRVKVTTPATSTDVNLLPTAAANFESGIGLWTASGTVLPTVAQDGTTFYSGTKSLKITWNGSGSLPQAQVSTAGLTASVVYTVQAKVFVPSGAPDVRLVAASSIGSLMSIKDQWVLMSFTFTQGASTTVTVGIRSVGAPAATVCYVDEVMLNLGASAGQYNVLTQTTLNRFTGYVQQWPVEWPSGSDQESLVQIIATDAQARAERRILRSLIDEEIRPTSSAFYALGEPAGAVSAGDTSGNQAPALATVGSSLGAAVTFGSTIGAGALAMPAAEFTGTSKFLSTGVATVMAGFTCAFTCTTPGTGVLYLVAGPYLYVDAFATGKVKCDIGLTGGPVVTDGLMHTAALRFDGATAYLFVDGVMVASTGFAFPAIAPVLDVGGFATAVGGASGSIGNVVIYTSDPGATVLTTYSSAALTGFAGESDTARLTRLAGYAGTTLGTLDTSLTNVAAADIAGKSEADAFRDVADAAVGLVFVNGSGTFDFHNRNRVVTKTAPDITVTADQCDPGTRFEVDMQGVLNYFEATALGTGSAQLVRNTTSELGDGTATNPGHGRYPGSASYLVQTDAEALDRANWIVYTHAEPSPRLGALVFDLLTLDITTTAALLAAEPDTWIRITGLPGQTPGGTTADLVVEGINEGLAVTEDDASWSISLNVANKTLFPTPGIYDDATYGVFDSSRFYV